MTLNKWDVYVHSKEAQSRLYKRTLWIVILSQTFGGAGLAAGITVGALLANQMIGSSGAAGLPTALFTLGSALSAFLVGQLSQTHGRRLGLSSGFIAGGLGAIGVVFAAKLGSILLLFISLFVYGAGTSTNLQARYAGTDLAQPSQRAKAVSIAMVATTLGAVAGPNLVSPTGILAKSIGLPELTGPFILAAVAYLLAGFSFFIFLRPDPLLVAKAIADKQKTEEKLINQAKSPIQTSNRMGIFVGGSVLILSQFVMVAIMTMTPIHMQGAGCGLGVIGMIIGLHVAAMYLPSFVTGALVDRYGRTPMAVASGLVLMVSGIVAAFTPGDAILSLAIALILLGLGWNFGLISGTSIIIDSTTLEKRAKIQGTVDVLVAIAGSVGGLLSGIVVKNSSYTLLGFLGAYIAFLLLPILIWKRMKEIKAVKGNA